MVSGLRASLGIFVLAVVASMNAAAQNFSFAQYLQQAPSLSLGTPSIAGHWVTINGGDWRQPGTPFNWNWGDGNAGSAWFPAQHYYADITRNYIVEVTAFYSNGTEGKSSTIVQFVPLQFGFVRDASVPAGRIALPATAPTLLSTNGYGIPSGLSGFSNSELGPPRTSLEYALDVGHHVQLDFCNSDVDLVGGLNQVVLKQTSYGGAYSLWYTKPVAMAFHPNYMDGLPSLSSMLHEMAHNVTLNTPADYRLGGKIDGPMNAIVSETLAQIFQHATAYEVLNHPSRYGIGFDMEFSLKQDAISAFGVTAQQYREYLAHGCPYSSISKPGTEEATVETFMALAYKFVEKAEAVHSYRVPLKRMMELVQTFNQTHQAAFQNVANESFRATFLVAALSYGFTLDLREEFRLLAFPINDQIYWDLIGLTEHPYVSGNVQLLDYAGPLPGEATFEFLDPNTGEPVSMIVAGLSANGEYSIPSPGRGPWLLSLKIGHWLRETQLVDTSAGSTTGIGFLLVNGDVDGDNAVTVFDYAAMSDAFDSAEGDPNWNPDADLDGDGAVTVFDYAILSQNFDKAGDE